MDMQSDEFKPKVGLITLTDVPRALAVAGEREEAITKKHNEYKRFLTANDIIVVDAADHISSKPGWVSFYTSEDIEKAVDLFHQNHVEAIIIGCWHWSEPMFVVEIARSAGKPILLYSDDDPAWAATCMLTAAGASLWETSPNRAAQVHERFYGDRKGSLKWIRGVCALEKMKKSVFVLWGGSYALRMEYLQDDYPRLKSFLAGDILTEDQYVLIKGSESIDNERIEDFIKWLNSGGVNFKFDDRMFTPEVLKKQTALYFAAKDRISHLGKKIAGVSVKCFDELSDVYGVDGCFIPAFIPFGEDSEGPKRTINTICEGDIKGLLTMALLTNITGGIPSLFGDVSYISSNYMIVSNCGASSIYYSCRSCAACDVLKNLKIEANYEGISGGAVGYCCPPGEMTVARLVRSKGKYFMLLGLGNAMEITEEISSKFYFGSTWPHTAIKLQSDRQLIVQALGANHLVATFGNYLKEVYYACSLAGIEIFRMDSDDGLNKWLDRVRYLD
ncbi:MAG: fucose isomerase [Actinobacteria bacterium]|nr:fucose isomerase [Actinomycetota bacterium]